MSTHTESKPPMSEPDTNSRLAILETRFGALESTINDRMREITASISHLSKPRQSNWPAIVSSTLAVLVVAGALLTMWLRGEIGPIQRDISKLERDNEWFFDVFTQRSDYTDRNVSRLYDNLIGEKVEAIAIQKREGTK